VRAGRRQVAIILFMNINPTLPADSAIISILVRDSFFS
jgi:hypothetical protein